MSRTDLLALTPPDLIALSNRGVVKRAARELEEGQVTCEIAERGDGELTFRWSDGKTSILPAEKSLIEGTCDCAAVGLCRCLVRAVLAYQRQAASTEPSAEQLPTPQPPATTAPPPDSATQATAAARPTPLLPALPPWDPGQISDDLLSEHFSAKALAKARRSFQAGQLIELTRGAKPTAHFHLRSTTLRFLVPGDPRYVVCDCGSPAPCDCVPLAVWAFRQLPAGQAAGLISTALTQFPVPTSLLSDMEQQLLTLATVGLERFPSACAARMARVEAACRHEGLIWPAEIAADLLELMQQYREHDALFESQTLAGLVGEWLIRSDAIRSQHAAVPQLFVRGTGEDRPTEVGSARLLGLGCGATFRAKSIELSAYLLDATSGVVQAITRSLALPPETGKTSTGSSQSSPPPPSSASAELSPSLGQFARQAVVRGLSLAEIGVGNLLIKAGKRSPSRRLSLGRAAVAIEPETFAWETLPPPVLVEEFAALEAHGKLLPPSSLCPRRVTTGLHVLQIARLARPAYDPARQVVGATLIDARGDAIRLAHPYTSLGRSGFEVLLQSLTQAPQQVRFVAGLVRSETDGMTIAPTCVVLESTHGRLGVQPWASEQLEPSLVGQPRSAAHSSTSSPLPPEPNLDPVPAAAMPSQSPTSFKPRWPAQLFAAVGELLLVGVQSSDASLADRWRNLAHTGEAHGYDRLPRLVAMLAEELQPRPRAAHRNAEPAAALLLQLTAILRLAQDRW